MEERKDDPCPSEITTVWRTELSTRYRARLWSWRCLRVASALVVSLVVGIFVYLLNHASHFFDVSITAGLLFDFGALLFVFPVLVATLILFDHLATGAAIRQQQHSWLSRTDIMSAPRRFPQLLRAYRPIWRTAGVGYYGNIIAYPAVFFYGVLLAHIPFTKDAVPFLVILSYVFAYVLPIYWMRCTAKKIRQTLYSASHLAAQYSLFGVMPPAELPCRDHSVYRRKFTRSMMGGVVLAVVTVVAIVISMHPDISISSSDIETGVDIAFIILALLAPIPVLYLPTIVLLGALVGWAWNIPYQALTRMTACQPGTVTLAIE